MKQPMTIDTFSQFLFPSNPRFSPDGTQIAFLVQRVSLEANAYLGDLHLYDCTSASHRQLTYRGNVSHFLWTQRGCLLFSVTPDKDAAETSFYLLNPSMGEAVPVFTFPSRSVEDILEMGPDRYLIRAVRSLPEREESAAEYEIIDEFPFWKNGKGFTRGQRSALYLYDAVSQTLSLITDETEDCQAVSVCGNQILYKAYPWTDVCGQYSGIYLKDLSNGRRLCLLPPDTRRTGLISFWEDGRALVATCQDSPYGNSRYLDFYTMDLSNGSMEQLAPYDYACGSTVGTDARLGGGITWKREGDLFYFITTRGSTSCLYTLSRDGSLEEVPTGSGSCDSFDVFQKNVVVCGLFDEKLPELYLNGAPITALNHTSQWTLSRPEPLSFTASDGFRLTGWIMKPVGYERGKQYPAILNIHGGPRTVFGTVFHHEMQVWANAGYFVFYTNPRGSDGFGTEFGYINGLYGTVDYQNLMEFTDYVLAHEPDIDPKRVGVTGGSYGGFMTNWIIGHTDRFRAAVSQRSIASWISFEHMSDIGPMFTKDNQDATTAEHAEKLWFHSPLKYASACKTPTLFIHSDQDYRCCLAEGIQMYTALKINGVPSRMCIIKGENHELSRSGRPKNRIIRMTEILNWMDRYLKA